MRLSWTLVVGLALAFPLLWWPASSSPDALRSAVLVTLAPGLLLLALGAGRALLRQPAFVLAGLGLVWCWAGAPWAAGPAFAVRSAALKSGAVLAGALAYLCCADPARRKRLGLLLLGAGVLLALLSLGQRFGGLPGLGRALSATIGHRNFLACILVGQLGLAAALALENGRPRERLVALLALPLALLVILLLDSRGALLGLAGGGVAGLLLGLVALRGPARRRLLAAGLLLLALFGGAVLAAPGLRTRAASAFDARHPTVALRLSTYRATWRMFLARPWRGWGEGCFFLVFPRHREPRMTWAPEIALEYPAPHIPSLLNAHDEYLQLLAEQGAPGLFLWLLALGAVARRVAARPSSARIALFAGWCGMLADALVSPGLRFPSVLVFFWLLAGLLLAWDDPPDTPASPSRWLAPVALLLMMVTAAWAIRPLRADLLLYRAEALSAAPPERARAEELARDALARDPHAVHAYPLAFRLALERRDLARAAAALAGARRHVPGYHPTDIWQARLALLQERPEQAATAAARGLRLAPRYAPWLLLHGRALERAGRPAEAARALRAAWTGQTNLPDAAFELERLCYEAGRWADGLRWLLAGVAGGATRESIPAGKRLAAQRRKGRAALERLADPLELGLLRWHQGRAGEAHRLWQAARAHRPGPALLGLALVELHRALPVAGEIADFPPAESSAGRRFDAARRLIDQALQHDGALLSASLLRILLQEESAPGLEAELDRLIAACRQRMALLIEGAPVAGPPPAAPGFTPGAVHVWSGYLKATWYSRRRQTHALDLADRLDRVMGAGQIGRPQLAILASNWWRVGSGWSLTREILAASRPGRLREALR